MDIVGLKYMFPQDRVIDWVYRKTIGEDYAYLPDRPDGYFDGLLFVAIFASDFDPANNDPARLGLGNTFFCPERTLLMTRSGWNPDAAMLNPHTREANGGHAFPDRNAVEDGARWIKVVNITSSFSKRVNTRRKPLSLRKKSLDLVAATIKLAVEPPGS